jgi:CBS domain-containing protein
LPENKIFIAKRTDLVVDVFKGLVKHGFMSVPVLQKTENRYFGFIDLSDIVRYVVEHFGGETLAATEDFWAGVACEEEFQKKTVNDLMKWPLTRRNPFHPVYTGYSLFSAVELLARESNLHRVPIVDRTRQLVNLITQSQLVNFFKMNIGSLGSKKDLKVADFSDVHKPVVSVTEDQKAIDAFQLMNEKDVTAVAVVSPDDGHLKATLSIRDLKTMSADARLFWRLYQKINNFIRHLREDYQKKHNRPRTIVSVKDSDTLEHVVNVCADNGIHRVFIVDENKKPIGVISLKDILVNSIIVA